MRGKKDRAGASPRPLVILFLVAVLAVGGVWLAKRRQAVDYTLGGALFPVTADQIEGLLLTRQNLQYRFDRQANGVWTLSGAASDYLDVQAMAALVKVLPTALGAAILPGTDTEDRRYEFNGPEAMRLRVFLSGGEDISLVLGALNPVTGTYFASGAGRQGCFPVAAPFRDRLFMLPNSVQAKTLLPPFERDKVQIVRVTRSGAEHEFALRDGYWWLRLAAAELRTATAGLPPSVRAYQALYDDRRRQDEDGLWVMASAQAIGQLIYEVSEIIVREVKGPRESAGRLEQWELDPPWRQVVMQGEGLNTDATAPVPDQFTIAFGPPVGADRVPALRRGNVLLTDFEAVNLLDQGLETLVEQFALNRVARRADRLEMTREGKLLLRGVRGDDAVITDGRKAWQTIYPGAGAPNLQETARHGLSQDLVVNLNRIEVLAPLPPSTDPAVLQDRERVRITMFWADREQNQELIVEVGYLDLEHLGAGAQAVERTADGTPPVGLWFPATGKLLQIPVQLVVTARSMVPFVAPLPSQ